MKFVIIGGVAAGTKAAAKLKRMDQKAEVKLLTKSTDISYAGCGLPYYIGGEIPERENLIVNTPGKYAALTGVEVCTGYEVTACDFDKKTVTGVGSDGAGFEESYDKLVIATGAHAFIPNVPGTELAGVFSVRTPDDAVAIREYVEKKNARKAVICGAGFIGLEIAENLLSMGLEVTVIDAASSIMPGAFDPEMADHVKKHLRKSGMRVLNATALEAITGTEAATGVKTSNGDLSADIVILAIGVRPSTEFLQDSGLVMEKGLLVVDNNMETNIPDVYAMGDCALVTNLLTGARQWSAMGSTANISARAFAKGQYVAGAGYKGVLGTGVVKVATDLNAGRTGLTEEQALAAGFDVITNICVLDDKAHYYPGASTFVIKTVAERTSGKLLGVQVIGAGAVDKVVDVAVTGITMGMKIDEFDTMDYAYAPPFSTAIHPLVTACYILENKRDGILETITPAQYAKGETKDYRVLDVHPAATIPNAQWIDLAAVKGEIPGVEKDEKLLLVCAKGKRGYFLQNRLKAAGYTNVRALEGGYFFNDVKVARNGRKLSPEDIKRVKGLGCLQDKRFDDIFNVRVITRNGKLTAAEQIRVAQAAEKFGSGEVTMTTRMTLEIQGVPYDNIEKVFEFLKEAGIDCGGTGSKVRPVVSCKGTTCQYGLIDTFALSQKIHELFYVGYHGVSLPHKFKIAVGGCPNNCVKPNLNDIGIIGQRVPEVDNSKCKDCKICQATAACPIKIAKQADGKLIIDPNLCNHCGRCVDKCPFGVVNESTDGFMIYIGGRWGKKVTQGSLLEKVFYSEEEVIDMVEKIILFYREEGISGERFADTIERLGFDYVQDKLLNTKIDKEAILKKTVVGGATC